MTSTKFAVLSLVLLAGQASAFTITLGTETLQATDMLGFTLQGVLETCGDNCSIAQSTIQGCSDDGACICSDDTASKLLSCQQCMFTNLISTNQQMPDVRAGSAPLLAAYSMSCAMEANVNLTKAQTSLVLPASWDGPTGIFVPVGGVVAAVGFGAIMAFGMIYILSSM